MPDEIITSLAARPVQPAGTPAIKSLLRLAVAAVVVATLHFAQDVLIPIVLATILSFVLSPLVNRLERLGVARALSVAGTVLLTFCLIVLAGTLLARQASSLSADVPQYAATVQEKVHSLQAYTSARLAALIDSLGSASSSPLPAGSPQATTPVAPSGPAASAPPSPASGTVSAGGSAPLDVAWALVAPVLAPVETTVIVLVIAIFILMEREDVRDRVIRLAGARDLQRTTAAMDDAAARLSRYFVSQLAVNTTFGTVIALGLWAIGIPSPALWGVLSGLLRFIPYVGPVLAAIPPLALAAAVDSGWGAAVEVALLYVVVEPITGYVVEPLLYGRSTGLAPIAVIIAAVFWTWLWGPVGLIISTPLTLCLVVMGRHVESLEFFDVLLGDRPALTPVDTFYQRMLGDDPDDALERAETALQQQSMLEYYDDIVLQALKRAADDEGRGAITGERAAALSRAMMLVLAELKGHVDPGATSDAGRPHDGRAQLVACVSGRGPFDDVVSTMVSQLLEQRGMATRRVPHAEVSRERIANCNLAGATAILVSYLDVNASATQLKYLVRRLRQHAPGARIIVGLWPEPSPADAVPVPLAAIGADAYVASLRQALDACTSVPPGAASPA